MKLYFYNLFCFSKFIIKKQQIRVIIGKKIGLYILLNNSLLTSGSIFSQLYVFKFTILLSGIILKQLSRVIVLIS